MVIIELQSLAEMRRIWPLIKQQNPNISKPVFARQLSAMCKDGYRCIVAQDGKKIVGCAGFWTGTRFWCGKFMEPDNVVVDKNQRNKGIGKLLMGWLEKEADRLKCDKIWLLSYASAKTAHRFYFRENYFIAGYVFWKEEKKP